MSTVWVYYQDQSLPHFAADWVDGTGTQLDLSPYTLTAMLVNSSTGAVALSRSAVGYEADTSPNLVVPWSDGELNVTPGMYRLKVRAVSTIDGSVRWAAAGDEPRIMIQEAVSMSDSTVVLPPAYRGDSYEWRLTLPSATYLVGAPGNVLAQIRTSAGASTIAATWTTVVDGASLVLSLATVSLTPGTYVTDVQIGSKTYLAATPFVVLADVSR